MSYPHPIKMVFFDIDETLYIKEEKRIPRSITEQVIPRLKAKGIIPAIATGRCVGAFPQALKPLVGQEGFELLVSINGQHNTYQDKLISHYPLEPARIVQAIDKLNVLNIPYGLVSHTEVAVSHRTPEVDKALAPIKADYLIDPQRYQTQPIYQLLAFYPVEQEKAVIESGILQQDLKIVRWHENAVDLLNHRNSKALGITDVLAHFGLSMENVMAFGDGLNDIEMLSAVGLGVAMGNGEARLKQIADSVTLPIEQDGILHALEQWKII